jgi:hypothetical protein
MDFACLRAHFVGHMLEVVLPSAGAPDDDAQVFVGVDSWHRE